MDLDKIEKLNELKEKGVITDEEFQRGKQKVLGESSLSEAASNMDSKTYSMLMHFSQFCTFILPLIGLAVPIVMWLIKRNDDPYIDEQGKVVANWVISALIYCVISSILTIIVIGVFMLIALIICSIIFTIMGAIRANDGVIKNYPLAIHFFKVNEEVKV